MQAAMKTVVRRTRSEQNKNDLSFKNDPANLSDKASVKEDRTKPGTLNPLLELSHKDYR